MKPPKVLEESAMHPIKKLCFERFRRLYDIELEMRSPMVIIGANGVGKTSLLDAISLLSCSAIGVMNKKINYFRRYF
jgi:predicted ATPase